MAGSIFSVNQLQEIYRGFKTVGINVGIYADPAYNADQMEQIRLGLESKLIVSVYAKPEFNAAQMEEIRLGLKKGLNVSLYADPEICWQEMNNIRTGMEEILDFIIEK
jgi:hypothetical protein